MLESCKFAHYVIISTRFAKLIVGSHLADTSHEVSTCRRVSMLLLLLLLPSDTTLCCAVLCACYYIIFLLLRLSFFTNLNASKCKHHDDWNIRNGLDKQLASLVEFVIIWHTFIIANAKDYTNWWWWRRKIAAYGIKIGNVHVPMVMSPRTQQYQYIYMFACCSFSWNAKMRMMRGKGQTNYTLFIPF